MNNLQNLIAEMQSFGLRAAVEPKKTIDVAANELNTLPWEKNAQGMYQTKVGSFTLKATTDLRVAMATATAISVGLFDENIDNKQVKWARVVGVK